MLSEQNIASDKRPSQDVYAPLVSQMIDRLGVSNMLSYGGQTEAFWMAFSPKKPVSIQGMRPWAELGKPLPSELVVSIDYLHSVSPLEIENTLDELKRLSGVAGFFHVNVPDFISDVVNPRTVAKPVEWWLSEFQKRFELHTFQRTPGGFYVIVYPRMVKISVGENP